MCPSTGTNTCYLRFGDISTVALLVGKKKTAFHVHVDLLCENSSFFKATFTSPWKENTERKMKLADDDTAMFELFVRWLYTQQYEITTEKKQGVARMLEPVRLYVLAEKYDVVKLKNKICRKLYEGRTIHGFGPCKNTVECAYDNLPQSSPMRRMLVDWYTWHVTCRWFEHEDNQEWFLGSLSSRQTWPSLFRRNPGVLQRKAHSSWEWLDTTKKKGNRRCDERRSQAVEWAP